MEFLGRYNYLEHLGRYLLMMKHAFSRPEKFSMYWKETARQMNDIGVGSLIIVCLISIFIGAVAAVQFAYQLDDQLVPFAKSAVKFFLCVIALMIVAKL